MRTIVLDSGAFIAAERRNRSLDYWLTQAAEDDDDVFVPAGVLAEIWRTPPHPQSARLISTVDVVIPLDDERARAVGSLLGRAGSTQIVDASVARAAIDHQPSVILTSDVADIAALLTAAGATYHIGIGGDVPVTVVKL